MNQELKVMLDAIFEKIKLNPLESINKAAGRLLEQVIFQEGKNLVLVAYPNGKAIDFCDPQGETKFCLTRVGGKFAFLPVSPIKTCLIFHAGIHESGYEAYCQMYKQLKAVNHPLCDILVEP